MNSIRFKMTAITIAAILTAILSVFLASLSTLQAENDRRSVEVMNLIAQDSCKSLEKYTESIEQSVGLIANMASEELDSVELVKGGVIGSSGKEGRTAEQAERLDAYLSQYGEMIQKVSSTVASHTHGIVTYYFCINPDISAPEHGYFFSRVGKTGFAEQEPLDARELDPDDTEHTTWYYTPIERGRPSWVGPYTAHFLNEMRISSYLVPIYKSGALIGVLGMDIPVDTLASQVSTIRVYDTGFACLLDADGHVLYHPELEEGSALIDMPDDARLFNQDSSANDLIRYEHNGQNRQMSFSTLSNGLKLAIIAPVDEINAPTTKLVRIIALITIAVVLAFAIITLLVMRFMTRPLERLTDASKRLVEADYDVELDYAGKDEVGMLTSTFKQMRDQLKENIEDLNRKARTDDLTGLPNQVCFFELAEVEKQRLLEAGKRPAVLYFNLLGMKHFNRQYGFDEGGKLLCEVARILARTFGEANTGRFGQDHFAAIADEDRLEERLGEVFEKCRAANGGKTLPVVAGIYQNSLEDVDASTACDRAKFACDKRRESYTSSYCYFDIDMVRQVETVRYIINHLDQALEDHWVTVYYQPIVRASTGRICDEEALARWIDPIRGFLSPDDFIPTLENAGLVYKLDLYMLDQVLEKIKRQKAYGLPVVPHSINLSRADFDACDMVEEIRKRVDNAGIARDRITIEITESIVGSDFDFIKRQVERFQELGFAVWMDDFGSGYSSLDVLQSISFDLIKFDMAFMRKLDEGESGKIILRQLMQMTNELGISTVCEGVETKGQCRFLKEIGCTKLQGYYFCQPLPFEEILKRSRESFEFGYEDPKTADPD